MTRNPETRQRIPDREFSGEQRQMGAMLIIHDGTGNVWEMPDKAKTEMAAGLTSPLFILGPEDRLNTPAGGRQEDETPEQTLRREFTEEFLGRFGVCGVGLPENLELKLESPYFFVVNQLGEDLLGARQIDQVAVSVWSVQVAKGSDLYNRLSEHGSWKQIEEVADLFEGFNQEQNSDLSWYNYRPQFLVAIAMMKSLIDANWIIQENAKAVAWAESLGLPVNNGAVGVDGRGVGTLTKEERDYLGLPEVEYVSFWNPIVGKVVHGVEYQAELF